MSQRLNAFRGTLAYTNTTAKVLGYLPPNAFVSSIKVFITTAFNDTGTDLIDIGISGTANYFANDVTASSEAQAAVTLTKGAVVQSTIKPTPIYATYIGQNSNASAGAATIVVEYMFDEG